MKSAADVQDFERVEQQLHSMLADMADLSKKNANDAVNKFKLKFINVLLDTMNKVLGSQKPFKDFEIFDENELPTNSDVVVMLSQYCGAIFQFRVENTMWDTTGHEWIWPLEGKKAGAKTKQASEFKFKGR